MCVCVYTSPSACLSVGESWGHASTVRVVLFWSDSERKATLYKSPTHKEATVPFVITVSVFLILVLHEQDNICL